MRLATQHDHLERVLRQRRGELDLMLDVEGIGLLRRLSIPWPEKIGALRRWHERRRERERIDRREDA